MNAMHSDFNDFLDDLDAIPLPEATKASTQKRFPCGQCGGTGYYQGSRVHQEKSHCFACRGKGYFLTDPRKLMQNRLKARAKKTDVMTDFRKQHADLIKTIGEMADRNDFARSLMNQWAGGKLWSENQINSAQRMLAKIAQAKEAKEAAKAETPVVDLSVIRKMFDGVVAKGFKGATYRAEGLVISLAAATGRNPGALYVKDADTDAYLGKIVDIKFLAVRGAEGTIDRLLVIASDPLAAALRHGQRTGNCACCGHLLTNHDSIDLGIGPICKKRYFG